MKLLLDQNLSDRIPAQVSGLFPDSCHVKSLGLDRVSDEAVWKHARENGFTILTKDWDFHQMSLLRGFPPKVIFLKVGNCSTDSIISLIRLHQMDVSAFLDDKTASLLILGK
jgi:predicted nuclease of predicted toxin-antitoxin system